ncbi:acetylornithine deacetylase [Prolixibacter bellariivorans]|uniref:Acetylornithine deacetylase n=1 Tax=Prolixibacter bellariivorans TaxID=314319 RepID=A0A5M4AWF2_9BACT|nr:M20 family metallo-hydrolase [Prolixibacter bellariivorans]GET32104.1 acetylornithine deacetylase [Prolixibacter bellariivorans]
MNLSIEKLHSDAFRLLQNMIGIPSLSRDEDAVAMFLENQLKEWNLVPSRKGNNLWLKNRNWQEGKPVVLFNSHIDTVKPANGWSNDPFTPVVQDGKLTGLGSNDAGASVVAQLAAFRYFNELPELPFNLIWSATAEEEISGTNGVASILNELGPIDLGLVGEPTGMNLAIAEKGLLVVDAEAVGKTGHAARNEGENAIYKALDDIQRLLEFQFPEESPVLGPVKLTVTQIEAGHQHNVVPDSCKFVIDVRTNECYSNEDVFDTISNLLESDVKARSYRLNSSGIPLDHPLVKRGVDMGLQTYGSPTTSDQAVIPYTTVKVGPGDSARSHTPDEYILEDEIRNGVDIYIRLLENLPLK